ncbi:YMGG-like glycine zipper-containing protein [Asaia astilbis]
MRANSMTTHSLKSRFTAGIGLAGLCVLLNGCGSPYDSGARAGSGALIGGGAGAAIGALAGGGRGAAIGALAGGALGAAGGAATTPNRPSNQGNYYNQPQQAYPQQYPAGYAQPGYPATQQTRYPQQAYPQQTYPAQQGYSGYQNGY